MRVIGIDPGTDRVGIGVLDYRESSFKYVSSSVLSFKKNVDAGKNLLSLEISLKREIKKFKPDVAGVEMLFFSKNKKTALGVSEARGIILKTVAETGIFCVNISPAEAKLAVAGIGNANKLVVAHMVEKFIQKKLEKRFDDETDAIAIAIAAAFRFHSLSFQKNLKKWGN